MSRPACPFHSVGRCDAGGGTASASRAAPTIQSASRPTSRFVPSMIVTICADASSEMKSRYRSGGTAWLPEPAPRKWSG